MKSPVKFLLVSLSLAAFLVAAPANNDKISLSIDGMGISDFIKLVAATTHQNIFIGEEIPGTISYAGNKAIHKKDLYTILQSTLDARGYTLVDTGGGYLSIVKTADATQMNLPLMEKSNIPQMQTRIFTFHFATAETMGTKIKHFTSKNGKITASKESNSVIVTDFPENIATIQKAMKVLDSRDETMANTTHVIPLKNSDAKSLVTTLNTIIGKMSLMPGQQPPSITSDDPTNSLIVIASDELFKSLESTVLSLDHPRQQVYVRAKIIEINGAKAKEVGIKYGLSGGTLNSDGLFTFDSQLGNIGNSAVAIDSTLLKAITIPSLTSGIALGVNIALLNSNGAADVLSEPSVLCIDNQESSIYVGKTESILTGSTLPANSGYAPVQNYTREDIGLTLKIKPRLSNDNKVLLGVLTKLEDIDPGSVPDRPSTTKREVVTSAIVNNGETVIIGGLIREKLTYGGSSIPYLSDIPYLGALFDNKWSKADKINLVILLTPYIVDKSSDLNTLRNQLKELDAIQAQYIDDITKNIKDKKENN